MDETKSLAEIEANYQVGLTQIDDVISKNYLAHFDQLPLVKPSADSLISKYSDVVRIVKLEQLVVNKQEDIIDRLTSVYNSIAGNDQRALFMIIDSDGQKVDIYLGIRNSDPNESSNSVIQTLTKSFSGQFSGTTINGKYPEGKIVKIIRKLSNPEVDSIASVTSISGTRDTQIKNDEYTQGLEKFILAMQDEKYTALILADATSQATLQKMRTDYESIYTNLSPLKTTQLMKGTNTAVTNTDSEGTNTTVGKTSSKSHSDTLSHTVSESITIGRSATVGGEAKTNFGSVNASVTASENTTTGVSNGISNSVTNGTSKSRTTGTNNSHSVGNTIGNNQSAQVTYENKWISELLKRIDGQLKRINEFDDADMWNVAAYFMSTDADIAKTAARTYKALTRGQSSGLESSAVNLWYRKHKQKTEQPIDIVQQYLSQLQHPLVRFNNNVVSPVVAVSGDELAQLMCIPKVSVPGLPVIAHAEFGQEIATYQKTSKNNDALELGTVFRMGKETKRDVRLNKKSLAMHTFITGSTGAGKSNTVYQILNEALNHKLKFMVIEPAKGEYKYAFGGRRDVTVLGTNPALGKLLTINPFVFSPGVHVLEHVDKLIEIFNVSWPMYAAMPAILKKAVLRSYQVAGWNLKTSKHINGSKPIYPNFNDLIGALKDVINQSDYSDENKSNYIGSLVTRVESLTNGLNGLLFNGKETDNKVLFDGNTVVDLSRVGSSETKSLIMGVLVMRLSEYRMTNATGADAELKHLTVLEEAHNLLRNSNASAGGPEGANMGAKSVEMISNAIAEMRTYGEGFIIVDQSPSAVDISAIRNTNTKIIMRLPEYSDRELVGRAAALNDEQIDELAILPRGVAAVYQNDWLESVLTKVNHAASEDEEYQIVEDSSADKQSTYRELYRIMSELHHNQSVDFDKLHRLVQQTDVAGQAKLKVLGWTDTSVPYSEVTDVVTHLFKSQMDDDLIMPQRADQLRQFNDQINQELQMQIGRENATLASEVEQSLLRQQAVELDDGTLYNLWVQNPGQFM